MAIVISRNGDLDMKVPAISQEQRDALWAAFVTSWLDRNQEQFAELLNQPEPSPTGCL
jgi:hypothetical protein